MVPSYSIFYFTAGEAAEGPDARKKYTNKG